VHGEDLRLNRPINSTTIWIHGRKHENTETHTMVFMTQMMFDV